MIGVGEIDSYLMIGVSTSIIGNLDSSIIGVFAFSSVFISLAF